MTSKILVVDDNKTNVKLLVDILTVKGYDVVSAYSGPEALKKVEIELPDLVILDVVMPEMNGYEVCRRIRENPATVILPVIMVTALEPRDERSKGLDAGADDFLTKPIDQAELFARVRSLLRIKTLFDTVKTQANELEKWNKTLEQRVTEKIMQVENLNKLRRFLSPQIADIILSSEDESYLRSHRSDISTVFCDLRGFSAFLEVAEPEEALGILKEYHDALETLIVEFAGTIDHRAGDGIMVFFNDPVPCDRPAFQAVGMAIAMRDRIAECTRRWRRLGYDLGFGVGISCGYATIGIVGSAGRTDYTANGRSVNLASRLCDKASDGQILISPRVYADVEEAVDAEFVAKVSVRGFRDPIPVFNVIGLR